jgi:hypothetical protein
MSDEKTGQTRFTKHMIFYHVIRRNSQSRIKPVRHADGSGESLPSTSLLYHHVP